MAIHNVLQDYIGANNSPSWEKTQLIERGLPTDSLALLREKGISFTEMSETVISPRTLKHRKARNENLSLEESERAIRVASIVALAERVFGNSEKALRWLREPDDRLEDRTPLSLLHSETGGRLVESMLWGIDEGIFS